MRLKPLVIDGPRMGDIAEPGETQAFLLILRTAYTERRRIEAVQLWTHSPKRICENHDLMDILKKLKELNISTALQVSITGLGGHHKIEPGVETSEEAFKRLNEITQVIPPERICLRVDPIQSWLTDGGEKVSNESQTLQILVRAAQMGVQRARTSPLQYEQYKSKIQKRETTRGIRYVPPNMELAAKNMLRANKHGVEVKSCATDLTSFGIEPGACFDFLWLTGRKMEEPIRPVAKRQGCLCFFPRDVILRKIPKRSDCSGRCAPCYAQMHS